MRSISARTARATSVITLVLALLAGWATAVHAANASRSHAGRASSTGPAASTNRSPRTGQAASTRPAPSIQQSASTGQAAGQSRPATAGLAIPRRAGGTARKASGGAWRIGAARHYGSARNASGYSAVVAPGKFDAWAFGGTNPGGNSVPVALRWNGSNWHAVALPAGLSGFIGDASAPSGRDVWAVGYSGGYALHWNGSSWSVAKRWRHPGVLTGVTAVSSSDVWVFGTNTTGTRGLGTWHFDGRSWTPVPGLADQIHRASALSGRDIWAVAADSRGGGVVEHYTGQAWRRVPTSPALAGASLDDVVAASPRSVWVVGNQPSRGNEGRVIVGHFNGRVWSTTLMPWHADTGRLAPDGSGGVWISTVDAGPRTRALIGHLTRRGHLTWTSSRFGLGTGVSDIAPFRGARGVWLSGGFLTETGGDAAVWSVGAGPPRRQPASHARGRVLARSAPAA